MFKYILKYSRYILQKEESTMNKTNTVKTKRKQYKRNSRAMSFRILEDIADAFVKKAEECGYNTTEALELVMQRAINGLLPKKEPKVKPVEEQGDSK